MSGPPKRRGVKEAQPPVIIVKRTGRHRGGHHGGAWKVAYADFVTTMMALFIVLWAASQSPQLRESIAHYFRRPSDPVPAPMDGGGGGGILPMGRGVVGQAEAAHRATPPGVVDGDETLLKDAATAIRAAIEHDPALKAIRGQIHVEMTDDGLRIQVAERDDTLFFEIGSATIKPALTRVLGTIAQIVGRLPNDVIVEGHTDTRQYSRRTDYSNWELSADRANSARRVLEGTGLRPRQVVRVVGLADTQLMLPETPLSTENRRVSIIVRHRGPATVRTTELGAETAVAQLGRAQEPAR